MKTLDLTNYGVQEMSADEMKETGGGFVVILIVCIIALALLMSGDTNPAEK